MQIIIDIRNIPIYNANRAFSFIRGTCNYRLLDGMQFKMLNLFNSTIYWWRRDAPFLLCRSGWLMLSGEGLSCRGYWRFCRACGVCLGSSRYFKVGSLIFGCLDTDYLIATLLFIKCSIGVTSLPQ